MNPNWQDPLSFTPLTSADIKRILLGQLEKIKQEQATFPKDCMRWRHCQVVIDLMEPVLKEIKEDGT